jgi:uncharacterized protein (UPF0332 family)
MNEEFGQRLLNNLLETWILPAIRERQEKGELPKPLGLKAAQIIFRPEGGKPEIRVNSEVKGKAIARLSKAVQAGDPLGQDQIDDIEAFELDDGERNFGHATLLLIKQRWLISFDFIYNKASSQNHIGAAKEFLHAAESSLEKGYLRACLDNLHSASELAAKAYLLGTPDHSLVKAKSHDVVHKKINAQRKIGNVKNEHVEVFNKLSALRSSARYLNGELKVGKSEVESMLSEIRDFVEDAGKQSQSKL